MTIHELLIKPDAELDEVGGRMRRLAVAEHSVDRLFERIVSETQRMALGSRLKRAARNGLVRAGGVVAALKRLGVREAGDRDARRSGTGPLRRLPGPHPGRVRSRRHGHWIREPFDPDHRTQLTLTFDDGYASWHESVAALLEERGIPAVFFVSSGLVGLRGEAAREFARLRLRRTRELDFIGLSDLKALADHHLFEVGSHTRNHVDLGRISDPRLAQGGDLRGSRQIGGLAGDQGEMLRVPVRHARERFPARSIRRRRARDRAGIHADTGMVGAGAGRPALDRQGRRGSGRLFRRLASLAARGLRPPLPPQGPTLTGPISSPPRCQRRR